MRFALLFLLLVVSCGGSGGLTRNFTRGWSGWDDPKIGCIPTGGVRTVRGTLRVTPFGKGADGTELVLDSGEVWIVAYGATRQHRELAGKPVLARGRLCDKQLQARNGQHFDIDTLTEPVAGP